MYISLLPPGESHPFLIVVDAFAISSPEHPVVVIDLRDERGRSFRALPATIQSNENNLTISNMSFFDFTESVSAGGVFRGF